MQPVRVGDRAERPRMGLARPVMGWMSCSPPSAVRSSSGAPTGLAKGGRLAWFGVAAELQAGDEGHSTVLGFSLSPDGRHVALPSENGLHIITTDLDELIEIAKDRVGRGLTDDECRSYLHVQACPDG